MGVATLKGALDLRALQSGGGELRQAAQEASRTRTPGPRRSPLASRIVSGRAKRSRVCWAEWPTGRDGHGLVSSLSVAIELVPTRSHELTAVLIGRLGRVHRTRLTKLLYLIDDAHYARFGMTLSGGTWVRYTHGPMLRDLPAITRQLSGVEFTCAESVQGGYQYAEYRAAPEAQWRFRPQLRAHELAIIDEVIARYGSLSREELIKVAYATPPMRLILTWEKDSERLDGVAIPFAKAYGSPARTLDRYRRLADAVRQPSRGTVEERQSLEGEMLAETEPLRRAATAEALAK